MDFAKEVKRLRALKGDSQQGIAVKTGVSRNTIAAIETGALSPFPMAATTLINLAVALGQNPLYFLIGLGMLNVEGAEDFIQGRFLTLPNNFDEDDYIFLQNVISYIKEKYLNASKKAYKTEDEIEILGQFGEQMPDPWISKNEEFILKYENEIQNFLKKKRKVI